MFIDAMRQLPVKGTNKTREQVWLDAFNAMQDSAKRLISDEQHFNLLGITHTNSYNNQIETNRISKNGLMPTINGEKFIFEIPKDRYLDTLGTEVYIKYDPYDYSQILAISKDDKLKVVCNNYERMPMALGDYKPTTPELLNSRIAEKKGHVKTIAAGKEQRLATLQRMKLDAQSALQAGVLIKSVKQAVTRTIESDYSDFEEIEDTEIDIKKMM